MREKEEKGGEKWEEREIEATLIEKRNAAPYSLWKWVVYKPQNPI